MPSSSIPEINNNFISTTTINNFYVPSYVNVIATTTINNLVTEPTLYNFNWEDELYTYKDNISDINIRFENLESYFDKKRKENIYMDF